jgi:hypothetical protein
MNAIKLNEKTNIFLKLLYSVCLACLFSRCDTLESDPDNLNPQTGLTGEEVFVLANSPAFIDLNSKVQSNVSARIAVTSDTRNGTLTDLGKGILQYSPSVGNSTARDGFEFTVYSTSNQVIKRDSVIIIIENDSTNLPCNLYPRPDYVYGVDDEPVLIDVLKNDIKCGGNLTVSVYKPAAAFPPHHGQAEAINNKIKYTPAVGFDGEDKIMYKVTVSGDTARAAYGIVYIKGDSACSFRVVNDIYNHSQNGLDSLLTLAVFANDSLCGSVAAHQVNVRTQPLHGQITRVPVGYQYTAPANATAPLNDFFEYEVCLDGSCKWARVDVNFLSGDTCVVMARPDSVNLVNNNSSLVYLEVLANDSICDGLKSLTITKAPQYGTSTVVGQKISYARDPLQNKNDSLVYEICTLKACSRAGVLIKRTN